ncbi:MAG TPA: histidine--tRNA ligase [Chitinophagales bacterium]|nr:histidine--tRNA ligase [Chitinophagales bacterium]
MSDIKKIKPALSKGTRDFLPAEVAKRNYVFSTIKSVFRNYGFEEIETPAIERLETLTGKYGEEGDKLLFKILNSGDYLTKVRSANYEVQNLDVKDITPLIAEKGLRYDLTVPLARYVVQNQDNLAFPFKRFHVGPVWRADKPQKGRYQEFYQCDADIIGSTSLYNEVELTQIFFSVYKQLGIDVVVRVNNRKILEALATYAGCAHLMTDITVAVDKLDKIGVDGVTNELTKLGLTAEQISKITALLQVKNTADLKAYFTDIDAGRKGLDELNFVLGHVNQPNVVFDITLARGLSYYTGTIWEVVLDQNIYQSKVTMGSLGGGGRYDNLTEMFGGQNMSGVGISFGIERVYDVMEELNLFPATISQGVKVLFVPRDISVEEFTFQQVSTLREKGIPAEIFLGNVKKQKQFDYVERKNIAYLVEVGDNEKNTGLFRLRNAQTRETRNDLTISDIADLIMAG